MEYDTNLIDEIHIQRETIYRHPGKLEELVLEYPSKRNSFRVILRNILNFILCKKNYI